MDIYKAVYTGDGMYKQMDIFDYIEKATSCRQHPQLTQFEQLFEKIRNPVILCANCLCQYCANNVEEIYRRVSPGEVKTACYNCDECREYSGNYMHKIQSKESCAGFILSNYGAGKRRQKIRRVK